MTGRKGTRHAVAAILREWVFPSHTMKRRILPPAAGLVYIAAIALLGGLRPDHVLIGLLGFLDLYNEKSRLFLRLFFPLIATGAIYDSMRYFYWPAVAGRVHVSGPYDFELRWFGVSGQTPNEFFATHHWTALDLACGFAYLVYVGEYLAIAFLLFFRRRHDMVRALAYAFLVVNLLGFATYFLYPAAPPWYVAQYGFGPARLDIHPDAAAASRFDALLGTHFFDEMYGRGIDVYGAYPSLHAAYPLIVAWAVFREPGLDWARAPAVAFLALMCLSAVYLQHHYVTDVVLGLLFAVATIAMVAQRSAARASSAHPAASGSSPALARRRASA
jgi:membrane-associated phospholipid phosphatase